MSAYTKQLQKELTDYWVNEQSAKLVEYAEGRIMLLGETIASYHSRNNMDDTGNLLDSLCWGVTYNGKYVGNGFYRPQRASMSATLHSWWKGGEFFHKNKNLLERWTKVDAIDLPEIWGHKMAQEFLDRQEKEGQNGWRVFFAILAPYWGYWEKGFTMKGNGGWGGRFLQFAVMSEFRDIIKQQLSPAKVSFRVTTEIKYSDTGLMKKARRETYRRERESNRRRA